MLADRRNRRAACKIAKLEPTVTEIEGDDDEIRSYVVIQNFNRRHMSAGSLAMAYAKIFPEPAKAGRGKTVAGRNHFHKTQVSRARTVLKLVPEYVTKIIEGVMGLDEAYEEAQAEKRIQDERAGKKAERLATTDSKFKELKKARPDLAQQVVDGKLTLEAAEEQTVSDRPTV